MADDPVVVVGVDGSAAALAAVHLAVTEAADRGLPLLVVHAVGDGEPDEQRDRLLACAVAAARSAEPDVEVRTRVAGWDPAAVLAAASAEARIVVVGMAGKDDPPEAADRSVALHLLRRLHCPLVVVRGRRRRHQRLVLALLTGGHDDEVVAEAAEFATVRAVPLVVEWLHGPPDGAAVDSAVARIRSGHPGIEVSAGGLGSPTLDHLLERAEGAVALVLAGPDGPARFDDPARVAVHWGPCPVVVVPAAAPVVPVPGPRTAP